MKFDNSKPVHVYRNLQQDCWSIKQGGKVVAHEKHLVLVDCILRVQKAGRAKVLRMRQKNVHAYVLGKISNESTKSIPLHYVAVSYDPYKFAYFYLLSDDSRIDKARSIIFKEDGTVWALE